MTFVLALIALGLGYLVFVQGSGQKKTVKSLGQIIGAVIMICAFASMFCAASKCSGRMDGPKMCRFSLKK